jgi:hypothetical protein
MKFYTPLIALGFITVPLLSFVPEAIAENAPLDPSETPMNASVPPPPAPVVAPAASAPVAVTPIQNSPPTEAATEPATEDDGSAPQGAAQATATTAVEDAENDWPRVINSGDQQLTIYQPQVESWKDNQLEQRAAVSVQKIESESGGQGEPTFGVIWTQARTEVDKSTGMVALENLQVTKTSFPSEPSKNDDYKAIFQKEAPSAMGPMSLERLQASLIVTHAEEKNSVSKLKNTPPKIIYSNTPASLVLIDGKPALRDAGAENILRVMNTPALILIDKAHGKAYLYAGEQWLEAPSVDGPFVPVDQQQIAAVSSLNQVRNELVEQKQVDTLDNLKDQITPGYKVYASTTPAELIQTKGTAQFAPLAETSLLYAQNSGDNIFLNTADQKYYVLLSGRWYNAPSLNSKWSYVSQKALPKDFAKIPVTDPKGDVLASVAGTPQAKEAVISNNVPQTATIERENATPPPPIHYDGEPQLAPIQGTPLQYVQNSPVPVIQTQPGTFYSVQNGIWFVANSPNGPWVVATQVPASIYRIPPSSPLYNVTYVYVYGYTPRYVYVGYLPGYLGSYVTPDGVVVYGTGYYYHPWIGPAYWYGPPVTFGFGVAWGVGFGWGFHIGYYGGYYAGPAVHPWWGPWGYHRYVGGPGFYPMARTSVVNINHTNVYRSWGGIRPGLVQPSSINRGEQARAGYPGSTFSHANPPIARGFSGARGSTGISAGARAASNSRANNVYADHSGNVYRHTEQSGWQRYQNHSWSGTQSKALEPERNARALGQQRYTQSIHPPASHMGEGRESFGGFGGHSSSSFHR